MLVKFIAKIKMLRLRSPLYRAPEVDAVPEYAARRRLLPKPKKPYTDVIERDLSALFSHKLDGREVKRIADSLKAGEMDWYDVFEEIEELRSEV